MSHTSWLIGGIGLIALELILPGGVAGALSGATLMIAFLAYIGWLTSYPIAFALWFVLSSAALLLLRALVRRLSPSQTSVGEADHDQSLLGTLALVTEDIPAGGAGRIQVGGTTWLATCKDPAAAAPAGARVRLVAKSNITWLVDVITPEETP